MSLCLRALYLRGMEPNQVEPLGCRSVRCATLEGFRLWRQQWQPCGGRKPAGWFDMFQSLSAATFAKVDLRRNCCLL